ncbi:unnamed protein product [Hermetia illucens]|uniref:28S rRNA (uridine-N(3))-methyltransferase n=1 Tax=Hermetia illucens TaxID=343691 RepID=A0A7R8YL70_HERIL|nr:putative methyltransferase C9orf114 [Hermetia illucens]CAD7077193.1 unnamed protein product [Hermetia illucens]
MSSDEHAGPARPSVGQKSWKKVNEERKLLKKTYKKENILKRLEKAKKLEELSKEVNQESNEQLRKTSTVSIAVPGSILENAQSAELRTYLAGQIARAACIFQVDEVVVFDDLGVRDFKDNKVKTVGSDTDEQPTTTIRKSSLQLARILQYLECPQYLRKFFFPLHNDLKYSGLLNPLDAPHHLRQQNAFMYREGIVTDKKVKEGKGSYVNVGLLNDVLVDKCLTQGLRVTVRMNPNQEHKTKKLKGKIVSPWEPRAKTGVYWGYTIRVASCLSQIFTQSPYEKGYDLTIGTSDKGTPITEVAPRSYNYDHALIIFGGLQGLERALQSDSQLAVDDPQLLFDHYLNVLPKQGSRTIRTEEAILISLAALQEKFDPKTKPPEFDLQNYIPQSDDTGMKQFEQINAKTKVVEDLSRFD